MSAKDTMRCNKTAIQRILSADRQLILDKVYEKNLITDDNYKNLKNISKKTEEGHVIELVDNIMFKGENTCKGFLDLLLMDDDINMTYPDLKGLELNYTKSVPTQETATSSTGGMRPRKASMNKEDKKTVKRKKASENPKSPAAKRVKVDKEAKATKKPKPLAFKDPNMVKKPKPKEVKEPKVVKEPKPKVLKGP